MICYHHNDLDGHCAGAIVRKYIQENFPHTKQRYVEVDYGQDIDLSEIVANESIYVVDFHFPVNIMKEMVKITPHIFVFDHHKTAAGIIAQYPKEVKCIWCSDNEFAGCELVWNELFPDNGMPAAVLLIGDRDAWKWEYGRQTASFNEGLKLHSHQPQDTIWDDLLNSDISVAANIQVVGDICLKYRDAICKNYREFWGYEAELFGHKCYVLNLVFPGASSEMFGEKLQEYDICVGTVFKNGTWKLSLRSDDKVDVSEIAKRISKTGGGHENAAGVGGLKELPFKLL